jgi:hypothetical protein
MDRIDLHCKLKTGLTYRTKETYTDTPKLWDTIACNKRPR